MATIRESLKKLVEVAKPVPGDEQEFVAKHVIKVFDPQGKDTIHPESPYELILKNIAAVKAPPRAGEDHGYDAPGESERAYHIPESRDAKIAKLSEMMGKDEDEDEDEDDEDEDDEKEMKEAKKQVVGVEMHYTHPTKKPFKITHFSVPDAERGRKEYEKMGYKLAGKKALMGEEFEQINEIGETPKGKKALASYINKAAQQVRAKTGIAASFETQGARKKDPRNKASYMNLAKDFRRGTKKRLDGIEKATARLAKEEVEYVDEARTFSPLRRHVVHFSFDAKGGGRGTGNHKVRATSPEAAKNLARRKLSPLYTNVEVHSAKLAEEVKQNDRDREERVATPRPTAPATVEGMRHRLQAVKKQIIDKT